MCALLCCLLTTAGDRGGAVGRGADDLVERRQLGLREAERHKDDAVVREEGDGRERRRCGSVSAPDVHTATLCCSLSAPPCWLPVDVTKPAILFLSAPRAQRPPVWSKKADTDAGWRP
jgi:hypothetical protein